MGRPYSCPYCGVAGKNVGKGYRQTKTMGLRRIRKCKACGRKFTPKHQKPIDEPSTTQSTNLATEKERSDSNPTNPSPSPRAPQPPPDHADADPHAHATANYPYEPTGEPHHSSDEPESRDP